MEVIYQNQWCKILLKGTIYVLHSKSDKYNDQYLTTLDAAYKAIGINPTAQKFHWNRS